MARRRRPTPLRALDYAATPILPEHVLASAAIPGAFPAVEVRRPREAAGWYGDGGVRLNAPLAPALALGAGRVVVIGLNSAVTPVGRELRPDALDGLAQLVQVALSDQLADDVATLATVNESLPARAPAGKRQGRRRVPYIFIAPGDRLEIGRLARSVYARHYAGLDSLLRGSERRPAGTGPERPARRRPRGAAQLPVPGAREFLEELIALGRRDAERWLEARHDAGLWQVGRL